MNSKAIEVLGLEARMEPWNKRDASGKSIGVIDALAPGGFAAGNELTAKIPRPTLQDVERNGMAMIRELNAVGLTASSGTCPDEFVPIFRGWAKEGRLNKRFFCIVAANTGADADAVTKALPEIEKMKLFQGDNWVDHIAYGEGLYGPAGDSMVAPKGTQPPEAFEQWGRIAREVARAGMPLHSHTTLEHTFNGFLDQIEKINKEFPVRNLRWTLIHDEQATRGASRTDEEPRPLRRHSAARDHHGRHLPAPARRGRAYTMPNFRLIQDSGIIWGLGTDAFEVNQYNPFVTLAYAVTGKMVGGTVINRATVSREDALIAHTRHNALIIMQENNLGSIAPGKYADLLVLDKDYLTVPADEIKDIRPAITMVGGRVVYDAAAPVDDHGGPVAMSPHEAINHASSCRRRRCWPRVSSASRSRAARPPPAPRAADGRAGVQEHPGPQGDSRRRVHGDDGLLRHGDRPQLHRLPRRRERRQLGALRRRQRAEAADPPHGRDDAHHQPGELRRAPGRHLLHLPSRLHEADGDAEHQRAVRRLRRPTSRAT